MLLNSNEPSSPDSIGSIDLSGWGIIPNIFLFSLITPAILFKDPFGFALSSILPSLLQYLNTIKLLSSSFFIRSLLAK